MANIHSLSHRLKTFLKAQLNHEESEKYPNMAFVTPLHRLLERHDWNLNEIEEFLKRDLSSINQSDSINPTPLLRVLKDDRCSAGLVKLLIRFGANVNYRGDEIDPPIFEAIRYSKDESIIGVLLDAGAHITSWGLDKRPAICLALCCGSTIGIIRQLLKGVNLSPYNCLLHGSGVMHCAMYFPRPESKQDVVKLLIEAGADVNRMNSIGESPMCIALQTLPGAGEIKNLLRAGFSLGACMRHASPLLCLTAMNQTNTLKADVVKLLLETGPNIGRVDMKDRVPLHRALFLNKCEVGAIQLLFDYYNVPPNPIISCQWASFLLRTAIQNPWQQLSVVQFLLEQGAEVYSTDGLGNSALHIAVRNASNTDVVKLLLKHGFPVNYGNLARKTPLRVAVESKNKGYENILLLLAAGARIEDNEGDSLLKIVVDQYEYRRLDYFKMLAKYTLLENPNFNIQGVIQGDKDYQTFSRFAEDCKHELQEMKLKYVGNGRSLREFVCGHFLRQMDAAEFDIENYGDFNWLLRAVSRNAFPIYFDVISTKVRRSSMKLKLEKLMVYTIRQCPETPCIQEEIILDYVSLCKLSEYLSDNELLSLISAFHNVGDNVPFSCSKNVSKETLQGKRGLEESAEFPKRPKLTLKDN